jgi:hypothetical protein
MRCIFMLALAVGACAGQSEVAKPARPGPVAPSAGAAAGKDALDSVRFASVPAGTVGPYVATTSSGGVAVWAQAADKGRAWFGVGFDDIGMPRGAPLRLSNAPGEVGVAVVEAEPAGFALLSTRKDGGRTVLDSLELDLRGRPKGLPVSLTEVVGDVVWIDLVATSSGTLALWGVKNPGGADLFAALVGQERMQPEPFVKNARAWQAVGFGAGAAVAAVGETGRVHLEILDDHGAPSSRVEVTSAAPKVRELDMVRIERGLLLAWSDHEKLWFASINSGGKLAASPTVLEDSIGEQALIRLVPPHEKGGSAYLAWESLLERPATGRKISLAPISSDGKLGEARATLDHGVRDGSIPELAALPAGLTALTVAKVCRKEQECPDAPLLPTYVELDASLRVVASEPLKIASLRGEAPDLVWGLSCEMKPCRVLGAQATNPTPVWAIRAEGKRGGFVPAARRAGRPPPPRAAAIEVIAKTDPLADLSSTKVGPTSLAAWVTYFDPSTPWVRPTKAAPDGRMDPTRALLQVRALPGSGAPLAAETISIRARSLGGVALAASTAGQPDALLAWTAMDYKVPQVFVTVVDDKGKKLRQRMLTRAPGEKSDVAATGVGDGWLLAWIDERSGDAEVYAARINRMLLSAGPDKRITSAAGSAAEVALVARGPDALIAWSDARDKDQPGVGDIYVAALKGSDASLVGSEQVVEKTPRHSRSPALALVGKGALLAWIEESVSPSGASGDAEVRVVELGADARPLGKSLTIPLSGSAPNALALECRDDACRVLMNAARDGAAGVWASEWAGGKASAAVRLMSLSSAVPPTISPALLGREVLIADRAGSEGRLRRLLVDWK